MNVQNNQATVYFNNKIDTFKTKNIITGPNASHIKQWFTKCYSSENKDQSIKNFKSALKKAKKHINKKSAKKVATLFKKSFKKDIQIQAKKNKPSAKITDIRQHNIQIYKDTEKEIKKLPRAQFQLMQKNTRLAVNLPAPNQQQRKYPQTTIKVIQDDSFNVAAQLINQGFNPAVLNMANQTHAGGGVTNGASAQEESLCRRSNLLHSIDPTKNKSIKNLYPLPDNGTVISPGVSIIKDSNHNLLPQPIHVDVLSNAARKLNGQAPKGYYKYDLRNRIRSICNAALANNNDSIVLGAHGCGAFKNDPKKVSALFKQVLTEEYKGCFKNITFAVINDKNGTGNFGIFHSTLDNVPV